MNSNNRLKYLILLSITMIFVSFACTNEEGETVIKGEKCEYYSDCKDNEICLKQECVIADSYNCTQENGICPKDLACSNVSEKCMPVECNNHGECSEGQFCNGNVCKTGCVNNVECGGSYDCNLETGECEIKADVNCLTTPEMCTENEICNVETKQCVSKADDGCASDWECDVEAGEICNIIEGQTNVCIMDPNRCETVEDCPEPTTDYKCNSQHKCELIVRVDCTDDVECDGDLCDPSDGKCVQCYEDSHCTGSSCGEDRTCVVVRTCTDDSTCPTGTKCVMPDGMMPGMGGIGGTGEGTCKEVDICYIDADCNPEGTVEEDIRYCKTEAEGAEGYCATENNFDQDDLFGDIGSMIGFCLDPILPCENGGECVDFKCEGGGGSDCSGMFGEMTCTNNGGTCIDGVCQGEVEAECSRDSDCAELYPDGENLICQRGGCMEDPTPRCTTDAECQSDTMHMFCDTSENICYSCVINDHCDTGATCRDHNCVNSSFCTSDSDCGGGRCVANVCE